MDLERSRSGKEREIEDRVFEDGSRTKRKGVTKGGEKMKVKGAEGRRGMTSAGALGLQEDGRV